MTTTRSEWVDERSKLEVEIDDEQQQSYEQELTNLRILEWLNEMTSDPKETSVTIQNADRESKKYIKTTGMILPGLSRKVNTHSCVQPNFIIRSLIDGDIDGFFCPGSEGRTCLH